MKFSKYTVFYEHGDNFLLVNTLTGALFTLDGELKVDIAYAMRAEASAA